MSPPRATPGDAWRGGLSQAKGCKAHLRRRAQCLQQATGTRDAPAPVVGQHRGTDAIVLSKPELLWSQKRIAQCMDNRDHSTVAYGLMRLKAQIEAKNFNGLPQYPLLTRDLENLKRRLREWTPEEPTP